MYQHPISSFVKKKKRKYAVIHSKETSRFRLLWERPAAREHRSAPDERHNTFPDNRTSSQRLRHPVAAFYIYITIIPTPSENHPHRLENSYAPYTYMQLIASPAHSAHFPSLLSASPGREKKIPPTIFHFRRGNLSHSEVFQRY